ncbi:MAG: AtpZ/AtpI family protein [Saprospiraceae bacterium]|nr:AtpZ/AtpI family protein [Saprospiraceae bacterium]
MVKKSSSAHAYMRYSGMAIQIFVFLAIAAYAGQFMDKKYACIKPYWTISFVTLSFLMIMVWLYYNLRKGEE